MPDTKPSKPANALDDLPTAKDLLKAIALKEAAKASDSMREKSAEEAEKKSLAGKARQAVRRVGRGAHGTSRRDHQAGRRQWPNGGPSRPLSSRALHRSRPRDKSTGTGLGEHPDRLAKRAVRILAEKFEAARLQAEISDRRFSRRHAGRCRHQPELGVKTHTPSP